MLFLFDIILMNIMNVKHVLTIVINATAMDLAVNAAVALILE